MSYMGGRARRFGCAGWGAALGLTLFVHQAIALEISNHYSPRDRVRPKRDRSDFIILHTTEAPEEGSHKKLYEKGEAHYFIGLNGHVYRIIHRDRVALHAGRSMWNRHTNIDDYSIGIEVVGYHNKDITAAQYQALRELLDDLKRLYGVPDDRVLTHSMVAYGAPNRWHRRSHRGRKRCGMLFAVKSVRRRLGLNAEATYDPDVRAGRLTVGDPFLADVLYGAASERALGIAHFSAVHGDTIENGRSAWDIARDRYNSPDTLYTFPDGRQLRGTEVKNWKKMPAGTRVLLAQTHSDNPSETVSVIGVDAATAWDIAGDECSAETTVYFLPDGRVRHGNELGPDEFAKLPSQTKVLVGYVAGGRITSRRSAFDICGERWSFPSTFYRFPDGSVRSGNTINENSIPRDALIFYRN